MKPDALKPEEYSRLPRGYRAVYDRTNEARVQADSSMREELTARNALYEAMCVVVKTCRAEIVRLDTESPIVSFRVPKAWRPGGPDVS